MLVFAVTAPSMTAGAADLSLTPSEDSFVRSHSVKYANTALGAGDDANAICISYKKNDGEVWEGWVYLKFNVTGIGNGKVDAATLVITFTGHRTT